MNHLTRSFLLISALSLSALLCQSQESKPAPGSSPPPPPPPPAVEYNPAAWKEFSSPRGGFTVTFPGTPTETDLSSNTATGQRLENREFSMITTAVYRVYYTDFPVDMEKDSGLRKKYLDSLRDAIVARTKSKVLSEEDTTLDGHPVRLTKYESATGGILRAKLCVVGKRVYQVLAGTPGETRAPDGGRFDQTRAKKFLDSFKLAPSEGGDGAKP